MAFSPTRIISISIAIFSVFIAMKFSIPFVIHFAIRDIPSIWSNFLDLLKPPFLYLVVNAIIVTIAAFSFLHQKGEEETEDQSQPLIHSVLLDPPVRAFDFKSELEIDEEEKPEEEEDEYTITRSTWSPEDDKENEKPLVSTRFNHRKPEGAGVKVLGVTKPKKNDTLDSTWKAINNGRHVPLRRQLKKSETMNDEGCKLSCSSPQKMVKSETFKDRTNVMVDQSPSPGSGKHNSIGQDELNKRVEAFIKKFQDEMRLQRQDSLNQYKRIVSHAR